MTVRAPTARRVAVLADIHGNLPALAAVTADIDRSGADEVLVGGDLVGRGPDGSAVVAAVRRRGWPSVRGNHEDYMLDFARRRVPESWWQEKEWAAARFMAAELSEDDLTYLEGLPPVLTSASAPGLLLVHGTPQSAHEGLGPWTADRDLAHHLEAIEESLLVCCHTHRPMRRQVDGGLVVNVGSVGLPFNGDRRAQYALFDWDGESWAVVFRQVAYELEETLARYESSGFRAAGGVTAELLELELRHARPFLVPFLKWAQIADRPPTRAELPVFLELYDPEGSLRDFFSRLRNAAVSA